MQGPVFDVHSPSELQTDVIVTGDRIFAFVACDLTRCSQLPALPRYIGCTPGAESLEASFMNAKAHLPHPERNFG